MEQESTKLCQHCDKHIAASKFRMHEVQCKRLNTRCPECNQVVMKSELDAHIAETHRAPEQIKPVEDEVVNKPVVAPTQEQVQPEVVSNNNNNNFSSAFEGFNDLPAEFVNQQANQPAANVTSNNQFDQFDAGMYAGLDDAAMAQKLEADETERLIAQMMQEDIVGNEGPGRIPASSLGGNQYMNTKKYNQADNQQQVDNEGYRRPDEQVFKTLVGGADASEFFGSEDFSSQSQDQIAQQMAEAYKNNQLNKNSIPYPTQHEQPAMASYSHQNLNAQQTINDNFGGFGNNEDEELQKALAASSQQPVEAFEGGQSSPNNGSNNNDDEWQNAFQNEDEELQKILEQSMFNK